LFVVIGVDVFFLKKQTNFIAYIEECIKLAPLHEGNACDKSLKNTLASNATSAIIALPNRQDSGA
jgi:hypothetical protein